MITQENITTAQSLRLTESELRTKAVLLAEDDPALRRYLEIVLNRAGYSVLPAEDGLEGNTLGGSTTMSARVYGRSSRY